MISMPCTGQDDRGDHETAGHDPFVLRNPGGPFAMVVVPLAEERFIEP